MATLTDLVTQSDRYLIHRPMGANEEHEGDGIAEKRIQRSGVRR
jgi:hypothetical protein